MGAVYKKTQRSTHNPLRLSWTTVAESDAVKEHRPAR